MTRHPPHHAIGGRAGDDRDRGSSTAELVIVTPIIIIMLLLVVAFGRYAYGKQLIEQAASAAARAASLSTTPGRHRPCVGSVQESRTVIDKAALYSWAGRGERLDRGARPLICLLYTSDAADE